jgi:hypothetical protein
MNVHAFINSFVKHTEAVSSDEADGAGYWTEHMTAVLHRVADELGCYCCCHGEHEHAKGMTREFLWDFTWYPTLGSDMDLPVIVIEHENHHSPGAFFVDFWKLMTAFAPLRVMVGYTSGDAALDDRIKELHALVARQVWQFPSGTTDLVVLRAYGKTWVDGPPWRYLVRAPATGVFTEYTPKQPG